MPRRCKSRKGVGPPQPKTISGLLGQTLKRCENDAKANVIIIDVDDEDDDDISDVPESQKHNVQGASVSRNDRCHIPIVICIDEDDEVSDKNQPDIGVEEGADDSNTSSSSRCPSNQTGNSPDEDGDECQFLHETSPVKLSKCKRTYCAKSPSRNRYGLGPDSDNDLSGEQSDKDDLDSEYMEDKLGELRELWEKANKIRKRGAKSGRSVKDGQFTTCSAKQKVEVEKGKKSGKHTKDQAHVNPGKVYKGSTSSNFAGSEKSRFNFTSHKKAPFADSDLKSHQETEAYENNVEQTVDKAKHRNTMLFREGAGCSFGPSSCSFTENVSKQTQNECEEASVLRTQHTVDTEVSNGAPSSSNNPRKEFDSGSNNSTDTEDITCRESLFQNSKPTSETRVSDDILKNEVKILPTEGHIKDKKIEVIIMDLRETENTNNVTISKISSFENLLARNEDEKGAGVQQDKEGQLDDEVGGDVDMVQDCLINNREKLKETDEYKRADEKEWASRQEALRLQAEEAQRSRLLLKRKKAETLRLLDMERRQKQRVEEIRKTQKKDEEDMNMKEKLRAEVRNELKQLEMKSLDMGSLLRGLGVHVRGGLQPQKHEIRAAYKKALLSFHPDRAPASDIRKLVEAEEKFKLISRMKDKFLPA